MVKHYSIINYLMSVYIVGLVYCIMEKNRGLQWAVVQFINTEEISTVPKSWISTFEDKMVCQWPKSKIRKHIQKATDPLVSWKHYDVTVLIETDNYDEALAYEKRKEITSDSDENTLLGRGARKKRVLKDDNYLSDLSDSEIPAPPKLIRECRDENENHSFTPSSPATLSDTLTWSEGEEQVSDGLLMPPPLQPLSKTNICSRILNSIENESSSAPVNENEICCTHRIMLGRILENVVATRALITEQNKYLENRQIGTEKINTLDTVPVEPFKLYSKLIQYDNVLKNTANAKKQLEAVFYMCGGENGKSLIRRGLSKMFKDKLAKKCSWTGRGQNFPLRDLTLMAVLKDAARKRFEVTDNYFETIVSNWFRQAQLRYTRKTSSRTANQ